MVSGEGAGGLELIQYGRGEGGGAQQLVISESKHE